MVQADARCRQLVDQQQDFVERFDKGRRVKQL